MGLTHHKSVVFGQKNKNENQYNSSIFIRGVPHTSKLQEMYSKYPPAEIYTFGGMNSEGQVNNLIWLLVFDGIMLHSRPINTLGTRPEPRYDHAMVALDEYKIIVVHGGRSQSQETIYNDMFVFVPESMIWSKVIIDKPGLLPSLASHGIAGKYTDLYIFGGLDQNGYSAFYVHKVYLRRDNLDQLSTYRTTIMCRK